MHVNLVEILFLVLLIELDDNLPELLLIHFNIKMDLLLKRIQMLLVVVVFQ